MKRFFTSDWHLGSSMINEYAHRPFSKQIDACIGLIDNCNNIAKRSDVVFHVGDFWLKGSDRHGKIEDANELHYDCGHYVKQISSRFVLLTGNHDDNHNCETDCKSMVLDLNRNWRNVYVNHFPSDHKDYHGLTGSDKRVQVNLCGHVHDKWLLKWDKKNKVINVNVGVDVWNYKPVSDVQLTQMLDYVWNGIVHVPDVMTRKQYEEWVEKNDKQVKLERAIRKQDRYIKKGLTPEECERRKMEALKKKGLLK